MHPPKSTNTIRGNIHINILQNLLFQSNRDLDIFKFKINVILLSTLHEPLFNNHNTINLTRNNVDDFSRENRFFKFSRCEEFLGPCVTEKSHCFACCKSGFEVFVFGARVEIFIVSAEIGGTCFIEISWEEVTAFSIVNCRRGVPVYDEFVFCSLDEGFCGYDVFGVLGEDIVRFDVMEEIVKDVALY
jgi:hypothetical protein